MASGSLARRGPLRRVGHSPHLRIGPSKDRGLEALATHWTAPSTLWGRRDAEKLIGGTALQDSESRHRQCEASQRERRHRSSDVSNTRLKLLLMGLLLKMAKQKIARVRTRRNPQRPRIGRRGRRPRNLINLRWKRKLPSFPSLADSESLVTLGGSIAKIEFGGLHSQNRARKTRVF
jgi:hypothetical protein